MFVKESKYNDLLTEVFNLKNDRFHERITAGSKITSLEKEIQRLKNKLTEVYLRAAVNGLEIINIPEKVVPAQVIPEKRTPAHMKFKKINR